MATKQEEVKLFGVVGSGFVHGVQIALKLKGIEYQFVEEDLANKSDLLLKYNPVYKKVPVFVHNEKPISESNVILEYIDETWKQNPILPSDPYEKALVRFWSKFIQDKIVASFSRAVRAFNDEKEREKNLAETSEALKILENELKDKFFGGEEIGFVDIAAVFVAFTIPLIQEVAGFELFSAEKFPKLYNWGKEFLNHSIVKEIVPAREPTLVYFKARYELLVSASK
ncbi:probable glutathione S-transferase [Vicia villosa]|uniref:probable glutathione S-transferase n=1 Tax=Vicia villosa TaxID=3911 RepID=UPI00273C5503|nr:probable glutathione S-transferase [Vicia villosa]